MGCEQKNCGCRPAIVQGSNNPLVIQFDAEVEALPALIVTLWYDRQGYQSQLLHEWHRDDMEVTGDTAICPITEKETNQYPSAVVMLEAKGLDEDGKTVFWDEFKLDIRRRRDKIITLTQTGG